MWFILYNNDYLTGVMEYESVKISQFLINLETLNT